MNRFLFLDVDGVLNSTRSPSDLDDSMIGFLKKIVEAVDLKIVLSSTWRRYPEGLGRLKEKLKQSDIEIFCQTPQMSLAIERKEEIQTWLDANGKPDQFVILDDWPDAEIEGHFFQTDQTVGLTEEIANQVIRYFEGGKNESEIERKD